MMRVLGLLIVFMLWSGVARAQEAEASAVRARAAAVAAQVDEAQFVRRQAMLEARVGLALYEARDDYRAITALDRWRLMADDPGVSLRSSLMIGHIYQRNGKPGLAALRFEEASRWAPDEASRVWALVLATQQVCVSLGLWGACVERLGELEGEGGEVGQLVAYHAGYAGFWSHGQVWRGWSVLEDEVLRAKGEELEAAQRAYLALDRQRPWLAAGLSAVLPGAGQAYNGRWGDAAVSFVINGGLGVATYYAFDRADSLAPGVILSLLLAGFYTGNVMNAYRDAGQINAQREAAAREQMARELWPRARFDVAGEEVRFNYRFDWGR
jgi:hypothetical protein